MFTFSILVHPGWFKQLKVNNIYFELFDKYFDSFAVSFACNVTYIFGSVVSNSISRTVRLGCLCPSGRAGEFDNDNLLSTMTKIINLYIMSFNTMAL